MKKGKNLLLLGALALGLSACGPQASNSTDGSGSSKGNNKDYDLLVWEDQSKSVGIEEAVKAFEEEHDVTVKVVEKAYADQLEDLRLDGPAGTGADVITIPGDQIGTAVTEGLLKEMDVEQAYRISIRKQPCNLKLLMEKSMAYPKLWKHKFYIITKHLYQNPIFRKQPMNG